MSAATLRFVAHQLVEMDPETYSWVDIKQFAIEVDGSDQDLLAALLADRQYKDHYAGSDPVAQNQDDLHGPYWLRLIEPASFQPTDPVSAQEVIQQWASDPPEPPSPQTQARLAEDVFPLLLSATALYQLPDLRSDAEHEWGWVVGMHGFHEFVAIDRAARTVALLVASDD